MMQTSKNPPALQSQNIVTIHVSRFQPFPSRLGIDQVIKIQFDYNAALVSTLKAMLSVYAVDHHYRVVGGWLQKHRCWFCECDVWEILQEELLFAGHQIVEVEP